MGALTFQIENVVEMRKDNVCMIVEDVDVRSPVTKVGRQGAEKEKLEKMAGKEKAWDAQGWSMCEE